MKKLILLAVVALIAAPVMAADVPVEINVVEYCAIDIGTAVLDMTVNELQGDNPTVAEGTHQATATFEAVGNSTFTVTVTPEYKSNATIYTSGMVGGVGDEYPTAYTGGAPNTAGTNGIGFGLTIQNVTAATAPVAYDPAVVGVTTGFTAGVSEGKLLINTYLDSGRSGIAGPDGGNLAEVGLYTTVLTLTVAP